MIRKLKFKNATVLVLVVSLLLSLFAFSASAVTANEYDFLNFTETDSMAFVEEQNIEIPIKLQQSDYLSTFTKELIVKSCESPNTPFLFNYSPTQEYAENIREAVRAYIDFAAVPAVAATTATSLQYSKVMDSNGNWVVTAGSFDAKWYYYNCYAYSINRAEQPQYYSSGNYIQYQPGNMSGAGTFVNCTSIGELASIVCADLTSMGYSNISTSSTIPAIDSSQELICVRMLRDVDYHFMRYDLATDAWYHKPSNTAVLKYNYTPSNSYIWNNERSVPGEVLPATFEYNSNIVFIKYSKNLINVGQHSTSREYIEPGKDVFCELNVGTAGHYDINLESTYSFKYEIYDEDFDVISSGTGTSIDTCLITSGVSKYYLRMNFVSYSQLYYVDVSIESHSHSYSASETWLSYTQHRSTCCCGSSTTGPHVVAPGSFAGGAQYATCLTCGGLATSGVTILSVADYPHTINGSYILPNGIIVLAPEDIEEYINGALTFITGEIE